MTFGRYEYAEARRAAIENPTAENLTALADWLDAYDPQAWNGEYYDLGDGKELRPIYGAPDEYGDVEVTGYEIR